MMTFFIIATVIVAIGVLSYYTSALFGVKSSNTDKLPPYYSHLLRQLKEKEKKNEGTENVFSQDDASIKR